MCVCVCIYIYILQDDTRSIKFQVDSHTLGFLLIINYVYNVIKFLPTEKKEIDFRKVDS